MRTDVLQWEYTRKEKDLERPLLDGLNDEEAFIALTMIEAGVWRPKAPRPRDPRLPFYQGGHHAGPFSVCLMLGSMPLAYIEVDDIAEAYYVTDAWEREPPDLSAIEVEDRTLSWAVLDDTRWFVLDSNLSEFKSLAKEWLNENPVTP